MVVTAHVHWQQMPQASILVRMVDTFHHAPALVIAAKSSWDPGLPSPEAGDAGPWPPRPMVMALGR